MPTPEVAVILPSYSASQPPPCYSLDPTGGEQCIQHTPRCGSRPTGTFTKQVRSVTVTLTEQKSNATTPSYGRHGVVNGLVSLDHRELVTFIRVKLHGEMSLLIPGGGSRLVTLVDECRTLFTCDPSSSEQCPSALSFMLSFPSHYDDKGVSHPLPPSFDLACLGPSGLVARIAYSLELKVVKGRSHGLGGLFSKTKKISVPLNYAPRSRPPRPVMGDPDLFSDLKIVPEEWHQVLSSIPSSSPETVSPVNCHLFIPSTKVFALSDTIPFHVQLSGPLSSLRELASTKNSSRPSTPAVRITLLRQISIDVNGQKAWRNNTLATGSMHPIPPPMSTITNTSGSREESLDWEGEIKVPDQLVCPSFSLSELGVKDFVVLTVIPAEPSSSSLKCHQSSVSVKLVTDNWSEAPAS